MPSLFNQTITGNRMKKYAEFMSEMDDVISELNLFSWIGNALRGFFQKLKGLLKLPFGGRLHVKIDLSSLTEAAAPKGPSKVNGGILTEAYLIGHLNKFLTENKYETGIYELGVGGQSRKKLTAQEVVGVSEKRFITQAKKYNTGLEGEAKSYGEIGKHGAKRIFDEIESRIGNEKALWEVNILAGGVGLTGFSKADVIVEFLKKTEGEVKEQIKQEIKLSMKSSIRAAPEKIFANGISTSDEGFLLALMTGKTKKEIQLMSKLDSEKAKKNFKEYEANLKEIEKVQASMKTQGSAASLRELKAKHKELIANEKVLLKKQLDTIKNTVEFEIDKILKSAGVSGGLTDMEYVQMMSDLKAFQELPSVERKKRRAGQVLQEPGVRYSIKIIQKLIEDNKDNRKVMENLLNIIGLEQDLDYLKLGVDKKQAPALWTSLDNPKYRPLVNEVWDTVKKNAQMRTEIQRGGGELIVKIFDPETDKDLVVFGVYRSVYGVDTSLPWGPESRPKKGTPDEKSYSGFGE